MISPNLQLILVSPNDGEKLFDKFLSVFDAEMASLGVTKEDSDSYDASRDSVLIDTAYKIGLPKVRFKEGVYGAVDTFLAANGNVPDDLVEEIIEQQ